MYQYIKDIDATEKFEYIVILVAAMFLATRVGVSASVSTLTLSYVLVGLVAGVILIYYINEKRVNQDTTFGTAMTEILGSEIMKPNRNKYLYYNSEFVIFLDNHREYYQYNPQLWKDFVHNIDNFQRLTSDIEIGTERFNLDYDTLKLVKKDILNQYQAFIHKLPHTENSNNKFHQGMERLEKLLNLEIDNIHRQVAKRNSEAVNTSSAFHYKNHPAPHDMYNFAENLYTFFSG